MASGRTVPQGRLHSHQPQLSTKRDNEILQLGNIGLVANRRFTMLVAVHLFLFKGDEILLLRRYNTGYEDGKYGVIAGHVDGDEEIVSATIREAKEEAGIVVAPQDLEVVGVMHVKSADGRIGFFLSARSWSGEIENMEPDKCDDLAWFRLDELPYTVIPYVERAIDNYRNKTWFDSFGWP